MANRKFDVAVILINYNSSQYTIDCVRSIQANTPDIKYQIIIIDNNSHHQEFEKLNSLQGISEVIIFRSKLNTGFSGANMMGVQLADADYYYFLNNDCILLNPCLSILYSFMEQNRKVANCSGEMFNAKNEYEYNFRYFPTLTLKIFGSGLLRLFAPEKYPNKYKRLEKPTRVDLVNGSSMFIRATAFESIGGFDTNYFLYCEEEDIALRLHRQGYQTYLVPEAKYQHFENKSSASEHAIRLPYLKEFYISFLYYYSKNYNSLYRMTIQILYFFKLFRKCYKNYGYARLAFFVLAGAHMKHSLRFKQTISEY